MSYLKAKTEPGLDCLICAMFAGEWERCAAAEDTQCILISKTAFLSMLITRADVSVRAQRLDIVLGRNVGLSA